MIALAVSLRHITPIQRIVYVLKRNKCNFSNVNILREKKSKVIVTDSLTKHSLDELILHETIDALIIPNYCSPLLCQSVSEYFLSSNSIERYDHDIYKEQRMETVYAGVDRVGMPFNKVFSQINKEEKMKMQNRYYSRAQSSMKQLRHICQGYMSPIDRLRLDLEDTFRFGSQVARFEGRQMFCGIGRITSCELSLGGEQPHFDMLPEEVYPLDKQFAANIYTMIPNSGGELQIWGEKTYSREEIKELSFYEDVTNGEEPVTQIKPNLGDLILFNTRRPHAVTRFDHGCRVTIQSFIGYKNEESLHLWN